MGSNTGITGLTVRYDAADKPAKITKKQFVQEIIDLANVIRNSPEVPESIDLANSEAAVAIIQLASRSNMKDVTISAFREKYSAERERNTKLAERVVDTEAELAEAREELRRAKERLAVLEAKADPTI